MHQNRGQKIARLDTILFNRLFHKEKLNSMTFTTLICAHGKKIGVYLAFLSLVYISLLFYQFFLPVSLE